MTEQTTDGFLPAEPASRELDFVTIIGVLAVTVAINLALTFYLFDRYGFLEEREIVSINAADTLVAFVASQDPSVTSDELAARVKDLNNKIDAQIEKFAFERGVIVVNSAAVLAGARDVTGDLLATLEITK